MGALAVIRPKSTWCKCDYFSVECTIRGAGSGTLSARSGGRICDAACLGINQGAGRIIQLYRRCFVAQFMALEHPKTDLTIQTFNADTLG
jgi:hypothetical protein